MAEEPHYQAGKITFPAILNQAWALSAVVKSLIPLTHRSSQEMVFFQSEHPGGSFQP